MSERYSRNPEASQQTVTDLYTLSAKYLEATIYSDEAIVTLAPDSKVNVTAVIHTTDEHILVLSYTRPAAADDPNEVDLGIPAFVAVGGENMYATIITLSVITDTLEERHKYTLEYDPDGTARAHDQNAPYIVDMTRLTAEEPTISELDANELIGQIGQVLAPVNMGEISDR